MPCTCDKVLQIFLIKSLIGKISIKVLQEVILELIPVGKMEVSHAFDDLLDSSRAVAENRVNLLLIIDDIVQGTEAFIVV